MVMDFVGDQERARKRTGRLVIMFILAVLGIAAAVYLVVTGILVAISRDADQPLGWWQPQVMLIAGGGTVGVIVLASLVKMAQLSAGGRAVAEALGGHLVHPDRREPELRRLLNVVEEMAIASGCPVPPVYLIDDDSINAFAAGYQPSSAVIGVTAGCVRRLNRDELQGVMAHEFSHIVHGDMRLNIRLTGLIFGIMALGFIGWVCFRFIGPALAHGGGRRNEGAAAGLGIMGVGLALMAIGGIGTLVARLIQAAVSRQREFLADAAAVDYTRNPKGIADALRTIGGLPKNTMNRAAASEFEHFFFTPALATAFATHPPLPERIARIEHRPVAQVADEQLAHKQAFGAERIARIDAGLPVDPPIATAPISGLAGSGSPPAPPPPAERPTNWRTRGVQEARESLSHLGDATADSLAYARSLIAAIPEPIREAVHDPVGAEAVCLLLLVSEDPDVRRAQATLLQERISPAVAGEVNRLRGPVRATIVDSPELRLILTDMVMPSLARLDAEDATTFISTVDAMQQADGRIDRFEWLLGRLLQSHFADLMGRRRGGGGANRPLRMLEADARLVLAMICWSGARTPGQAQVAFRAAARKASIGDADFPARSDCSVTALDRALDRLQRLRFADRRILLDAAVEGVFADGHATIEEVEILRALAAAIECPMPPVLPGPAARAGEQA